MVDTRLISKGIEKPKKIVRVDKGDNNKYGKFVIEPFQRGFGISIGTSLRRCLLSSIVGASVTAVRIDGVMHEFSAISGVREDTTEIIMNLKKIRFSVQDEEMKILRLSAKGEKDVRAADFEPNASLEIINPDQHIATLDASAKLDMEVEISLGRGYVPSEQMSLEEKPIGTILIDGLFSPVRKVNVNVESTRVGNRTDYDKLILEVYTDGTIEPEDAIAHAAKILKDHLNVFINFEEKEEIELPKVDETKEKLKKVLTQSVEELELSVRASNCLKGAEILTLGELVVRTETEMLKYRNFGKKSLNEIQQKLSEMGLRLGMKEVQSLLDEISGGAKES